MKKKLVPKKIIISRTDSIGDVCLTLPICKALKNHFPAVQIVFLGKTYTKAVIDACPYVDEFLNFSDLENKDDSIVVAAFREINADAIVHVFPNKKVAKWAKEAAIPVRIGTSHRIFHWLTCNYRPNFTRKNSNLHEAQLNFELLQPFGIPVPSFDALKTWKILHPTATLPEAVEKLFSNRKKVILHCKSQGSAVEWGIENFMQLARELVKQDVQVFFTGTASEGQLFRSQLPQHPLIVDVSGQLSLDELIAFIARCDVLVAASTGPLHLAGLLGIKAIGLFAPRRPIHPGRWQALGENAVAIVKDQQCTLCAQGKVCECISEIGVGVVLNEVLQSTNV
jgi:ADP-heptose:LPS heptosyltransferase